MTYVLILAGGRGERFWPLSRQSFPKQFISLSGKGSLLQNTFKRALTIAPAERVYVVTNKSQATAIKRQLPELKKKNIILEPAFRNTAACIGLASVIIRKIDPDAVTVVMPSDHIIKPNVKLERVIKRAVAVAKRFDCLMLVGVRPSYPATGFGYLKLSKFVSSGAHDVSDFIEKPKLNNAKVFFKDKSYAWNSGLFIWRVEAILDSIREHLPKLYKGLNDIYGHLDSGVDRVIEKNYREFENISIDKGVLEKSSGMKAVVSDFFWCDVGSLKALERILPKDNFNNVVQGNFIGLDTKDCIAFCEGNHLLGAIGVNNLVMVKSGDATLICPKERLEEIKNLYNALKERKKLSRFS